MAKPRRTQKQIAERYKGNLGYNTRLHPWRRWRFITGWLTIIAGLIAIWIFQTRGRETFFNAGKISTSHARFADDCAKCHDKSLLKPGVLTPEKFTAVVRERFRNGVAFDPIDRKCETCHAQHAFHEANVVQNKSCSACHQEHQGARTLKLVASSQCASCHANSAAMAAATEKGLQLPPTAFHRHPHPAQQIVFELPRPPRGYTQVFSSFWTEHPEFQLARAKPRDPDVLRFNHQRHLAADIPSVNGQKLDCNYCHKPAPDGRFYQRISFSANCQACHSLQFDAKNPELKIPHGNATAVLGFLRSLTTQYEDLARSKGLAGPNQIRSFVEQQRRQLRAQFNSDDELIRSVFFTIDPYKQQQGSPPRTRGQFAGCAFCHEVKPVTIGAPMITKPILIDRWMSQANFDHAKHQTDPNTHAPLDCNICHHASQSRDTSDVLMPVKANCVTCHSPQGKVVAECITCHTYHAPPAAQTIVANAGGAAPVSVKQMLLGR
jgi:hypothetical protein